MSPAKLLVPVKLLVEVLGPVGAAAIGGALLVILVEAVRWMWGKFVAGNGHPSCRVGLAAP
jgi:hypothetical protein